MQTSDLRIALFSGNYNYVRDGANQALNRLVGYLLSQGASVRIYSPTVENPAFEATGDLVSVPSMAIPFRSEYRIPLSLSRSVRRDLEAFNPNIVHIASPDRVSRKAVKWAKKQNLPVLCAVYRGGGHTTISHRDKESRGERLGGQKQQVQTIPGNGPRYFGCTKWHLISSTTGGEQKHHRRHKKPSRVLGFRKVPNSARLLNERVSRK